MPFFPSVLLLAGCRVDQMYYSDSFSPKKPHVSSEDESEIKYYTPFATLCTRVEQNTRNLKYFYF